MLRNIQYCILYFVVIIITSQCRKYDINEESNKLYGEDLNRVVQRFRRTPEYLEILNLKLADLMNSMEKVQLETFIYNKNQLDKKIREIFGGNTTLLRSSNTRPFFENVRKKQRKILKSGSNRTGVNVLDNYKKFHSLLTLEERNRMQAMGYEYFGRYLHEFMVNWAPDDSLPISTQLPDGGDQPVVTTTEHNHEVTTQTETEETEPSTEKVQHHSTAAPESNRNFRSPKV